MRNHDSLQLDDNKVHGPFSFLNPTQAHYNHVSPSAGKASEESDSSRTHEQAAGTKDEETQPASNIGFKWTSRNNRKGRHALAVKPADKYNAVYETPLLSSNWRTILKNIWRMLVYYPVWDISWWVAYLFTWGSIVWVFNAFFVFLPLVKPSTEFHNEILVGGGVTAFIGATVFEIGSVLLMLEAVNENRASCFGWAVEEALGHRRGEAGSGEEKGALLSVRPAEDKCLHHHQNRKNFVGQAQASALQTSTENEKEKSGKDTSGTRSWTWYPSAHDIKTHYIHDLGFLACTAQMIGATIFWIAGFTALPGILNNFSPLATTWAYWFPQVVGGSGFVISGLLFMIETQSRWSIPAPNVLGWHIGLWNLIGGGGVTVSPCFGFDSASWAQYQAGCSTFWGSWAFLVGSLIQLYESLEKSPVEHAEE